MSRRPFCFPERTETIQISSRNRPPHGRIPRHLETSSLITLSPISISFSTRAPSISKNLFIETIPNLELTVVDPVLLYVKLLGAINLTLSEVGASVFREYSPDEIGLAFSDNSISITRQVYLSPIEMQFSNIGPIFSVGGEIAAINLALDTAIQVSKNIYLSPIDLTFSSIDPILEFGALNIDVYLSSIDLTLSMETINSFRQVIADLTENITFTNPIQVNKNVYLSPIEILFETSDPYNPSSAFDVGYIDLSLSTSIYAAKSVNASTQTITLSSNVTANKTSYVGSDDLVLSTSLVINKTVNLAVENLVFESNEPL